MSDSTSAPQREAEPSLEAVKALAEDMARRDFGMLGFRNSMERGVRERYEADAYADLKQILNRGSQREVGLYELDRELVAEFTRHAFPDGSVSDALSAELQVSEVHQARRSEGNSRG